MREAAASFNCSVRTRGELCLAAVSADVISAHIALHRLSARRSVEVGTVVEDGAKLAGGLNFSIDEGAVERISARLGLAEARDAR